MSTVIQSPTGRGGHQGHRDRTAPPSPIWVPPPPTPLELVTGTAVGIGSALAAPLIAARVFGALGPLLNRPAPPSASGSVALVPPPAPRRPTSTRAERAGAGLDRDPGWFGPHSVAWKVHADTSIFVAGMAAFALQSLHPLALAGVVDHSSFAQDFMGRIRRTGEFVSGVVYGSSAEAARRVAGVRRIHERVVGVAPDGRPYSANDPELLEWVHITEYMAIAAAFRRFGLRPLGVDELDRYVGEVAVVGEAMGVTDPPRSWSELDARFQRFRPQLAVGEQAALALRFLREPPGLPAVAMPAWRTVWAGALTCLPPSTLLLIGVRPPRRTQIVACRSLVRALGAVLGPPPPSVAGRHRVAAD